MKAALVQPGGRLGVTEVPAPEAGAGEVVVRVAYCGICGSDLHMLAAGLLPAGCVIGHELSGRVASVGQGVQGWEEGDPVVVLPMDPCFACAPCRRGDTQVCVEMAPRGYGLGGNPGGFAEFMRVRPPMLFRLPEGLGLREAALNEPWAVALHGVNLAGFRVGGRALVLGGGPIGLMTLFALRAAGAVEVVVSEPDARRAARARAAGAARVVDPSRESVEAAARGTDGALPGAVFDCAGTEGSLQEAISLVDHHGRAVVRGVCMGNVSLFPFTGFMREASVTFSFAYRYREFGEALRLLARGAVDPEALVSGVVPLERVQEGLDRLRRPGEMKVLVDCGGR